jgi:hypothetical protein
MASEFLDSVGVIHIDFLPHGVTINAQYYRNLLLSDSEEKTWETVKEDVRTA